MNLALEKGERVTTGGKGRGEIREVIGVVADARTTDGLGKRYGTFSGWQLEKWRYCWWLVGLMWTEVRKLTSLPFNSCWNLRVLHNLPPNTDQITCCHLELAYQFVLSS